MLGTVLKTVIRKGSLTLAYANGRSETLGTGDPHVTVRFHDRRAPLELALKPELRLGELYMDGRLTVENGDIADLLGFLQMNLGRTEAPGAFLRVHRALRRMAHPLVQWNGKRRARKNTHHHYDLSGRLYDVFLDRDKQYSCAYFSAPDETLDEAQIGKKRHIAAKLYLNKPGLNVLDIGSGWGGLALDLARDCGANVLGVTLSDEQLAVANSRAKMGELADRAKFELRDYRALTGTFDRIVSVGMFEHVGAPQYPVFFAKVNELLADDGVAVLHTIGRTDGPGGTNPWIEKYIFPGGYTPALSEIVPVIERAGLIITDVEVLRLHYAETLKEWRTRFKARWEDVAKLYDERFCRMWEFYLAGAEMGFRHEGLVVFQIQMTKRIDALPITRDYMFEAERTMKFAGTAEMPKPKRVA